MTHATTETAGIDTSKEKLDVAIHGQKTTIVVDNAGAGWRKLTTHLNRQAVRRVGIEATGGYERGVVSHLRTAGFEVILLQPLQVKAFGQLRLQRAKNDRIDALLIAACTYMIDAHNKMSPDPRFEPLGDLLTYIEQVEEDLVCYKTRLEHVAQPRLIRTINADIKRLQKRRADEIKRLLASLRSHDDLAKRLDLVVGVPGIGERTALSIVVRMPELGQVSREAAASLAGLAPFVHQSGKHTGETHIGGGRKRLRRALYAAALPAAFLWNPNLKALYRRMTERGHAHKSALVACARKLLIYANTVVARGTPWQATLAQS